MPPIYMCMHNIRGTAAARTSFPIYVECILNRAEAGINVSLTLLQRSSYISLTLRLCGPYTDITQISQNLSSVRIV